LSIKIVSLAVPNAILCHVAHLLFVTLDCLEKHIDAYKPSCCGSKSILCPSPVYNVPTPASNQQAGQIKDFTRKPDDEVSTDTNSIFYTIVELNLIMWKFADEVSQTLGRQLAVTTASHLVAATYFIYDACTAGETMRDVASSACSGVARMLCLVALSLDCQWVVDSVS
jgi:hypothetical protein